MKKLISLLIFLLFLSSSCTAELPAGIKADREDAADFISKFDCVPISNGIETGKLIEVIDGDTIDISMEGKIFRVRYIGINSPEYDEGQEATDFNERLVKGQDLYLVKDTSETDRYGRLLRYVFTPDAFVNEEMVFQGYALHVDYDPDTACSRLFADAEKKAEEGGQGIWATPSGSGETSAVQITGVNYNGKAGENEPDEYVEICNTGSQAVDIGGWYLKDQGKHRFIFPQKALSAGETCRVYTNEDHPETCGFSFGIITSAVWNNGGDCAMLHDAQGLVIDEFCYP